MWYRRPVFFERRFSRAICSVAMAGWTAACGASATARLEVELATAPVAGSGPLACVTASDGLPPGVDCVTVTVCQRTASGCVPLQVSRPGDDHAVPASELRFDVDASRRFALDVEVGDGRDRQLELRAYAGGVPFARGLLADIGGAGARLRVRLERYGMWSCAGPRDDGAAPAARALHQAVRLPTGDVLVLGGVTGQRVSPSFGVGVSSGMLGATLERSVEVYDAVEGRFHVVQLTDVDGDAGFGAVLHRAEYVETLPSGEFRIRSIGGFTAGGEPAARFDEFQSFSQFGSPLLPGGGATVRDSVDILYDPRTRSATVRSIEPGARPRVGLAAVTQAHPDTGAILVGGGLLTGGGTGSRPSPMVGSTWFEVPRAPEASGTMGMLATSRFGASASWLADGAALIWGGNVSATSRTSVDEGAGELAGTMSGTVAAAANGMPPATALHTATPLGEGVLIAGGAEVTPLEGMSGGIGTLPSRQPLTLVTMTGGALRGVSIDPGAWPSPILHAATPTSSSAVMLVGGAQREGMPGSQLHEIGQVIQVDQGVSGGAVTRQPDLIVGRWGHQATWLGDDRVLVTGGFRREGAAEDALAAISAAEVLLVVPTPASISGCAGSATADGGSSDGGVPGPLGDAAASMP